MERITNDHCKPKGEGALLIIIYLNKPIHLIKVLLIINITIVNTGKTYLS